MIMYVITGPTASGKSALAIELAKRLGTEIISADSRQIYKGIPISTAQPSPEQLAEVKHHLVGELPLDAYFSASLFEEKALEIGKRLMESKGSAVVCGGSMMYVDALCNGIDPLPTVPDNIRLPLLSQWQASGDDWLRMRLMALDEDYYNEVDLMNMKRVFHAVEISLAAGRPYSALRTGSRTERDFRIVKVCLEAPREILFDRINRRVLSMMEEGLEEEARSVFHLRHLNSLNTVGLKEMFDMFDGKFTREEAVARLQKNTRVYAKKQITWFKRDDSLLRIDIRDNGAVEKILESAC